jgi:hypothetical protein
MIEAEIEGSAIPEAVPVEGVVPETEVATEATTEPAEIAAPGWPKKCVAMPCQRLTWR